VHPDAGCIGAAVKRKAFGRALRTVVKDTSEISRWAESQMDKQ